MWTSRTLGTQEFEELCRQTEARLLEEDEEYRHEKMLLQQLRDENARLDVEAAERRAAAQHVEDAWQRDLLRRKNTRALASADALHGPGLIEKLEEKWTDMSQHPEISKIERWARWAVLKEEHADELTGVVVDQEQLITPEVLDNLVAILQNLDDKCERNVGPFGDRIWIYADQLGEQDAKVLMALCKCHDVCFTYVQNDRITKSSARQLDKDSNEWGAIFDV